MTWKPKPTFRLKPLVFCDSCPQALRYIEQGESFILVHDNSGCIRDGMKFYAPTIDLEQIEDSCQP